MNRTFRLILLSLLILALPGQAAAGAMAALGKVCTVETMPAPLAPMMSRHAAIKSEAEAALAHQAGSACHDAHGGKAVPLKEQGPTHDDGSAATHHHAAGSGCAACDTCAVSAALSPATPLPLSQFRHMLPQTPLGTLADTIPDSLLRPPSARC
ncbi:hypothetical protein [Cupriavidus sp. AU9028]|uniref:hypothetical protein n=1 Tax=Cupriavidus sp. AU9028 TaxID=2871157 RepID=UPI001C95A976|nr:hypothetical protein [Cupriavidus sp. AU9028]MBY4897845.1 hypothetical protein [Cupriavidus sp. AU9028]